VVPEHVDTDDGPAERRVGALHQVVVDVLLVVHRVQTLRTEIETLNPIAHEDLLLCFAI